MIKVAVTGATGFVGENLCHFLELSGYEVIRISRGSHGDFLKIQNWEEIFEGINVVIHLAAIAHRDQRNVEEGLYDKINHKLVMRVAKGAVSASVNTFIFLSSAKVYGEKTNRSMDEDDEVNPQDLYSKSKVLAEKFLLSIEGVRQLYILRVPVIYGSGVKANFQALMKLSKLPLPLPIGDFRNKKSYLSIDNLLSAIQFLISRKVPNEYEILNVADSHALSLVDVVQISRRANNQKRNIFWVPSWLIRIALTLLGRRQIFEKLHQPFEISTDKINRLGWTAPALMEESLQKVF